MRILEVKALAPSASFHFEGKFASWDESMQALYKWFSPPKYKVDSRDKPTGKGAGKGDGKGKGKSKGGDSRGRGGQAGRGVATAAALMAPALVTSTPVDSHFSPPPFCRSPPPSAPPINLTSVSMADAVAPVPPLVKTASTKFGPSPFPIAPSRLSEEPALGKEEKILSWPSQVVHTIRKGSGAFYSGFDDAGVYSLWMM